MYASDITIGTKTYSLQSQRTLSSVRSDATRSVSEPRLLTISHENAKNGRRSSVIIIDDNKVVSIAGANVPVSDNVRVLLKVQFAPSGGRTTTTADINELLTQLTTFLGTPANVTKLLNQES